MSNVELPKGLKELGSRVFSDSGIESIIIPDGIEVIRESLFNCCRSLISVSIPNSVTTIENYAFSQCRLLSSISMSDNVIAIVDGAFACCSSLPVISLSNSVQEIGKGTFYDCESLMTILIPVGSKPEFEELLPECKDKLVEQDKNENLSTEVTKDDLANAWTDEYGVKYSVDRKRLLWSPEELEDYSIYKGTKIVCNSAFSSSDGCSKLTSIHIPNSVTTIGNYVFSGCFELGYIFIPHNTFDKFGKMLPKYREILMEELTIENHKGHRRVFCKKELEVVNRAKVVQGQYTKLVCFYMNDGCQKYIPLCRQSHLSIGDEVDLNTAKLIKLSGEGIYYGYIDGREYYDNNLVDA